MHVPGNIPCREPRREAHEDDDVAHALADALGSGGTLGRGQRRDAWRWPRAGCGTYPSAALPFPGVAATCESASEGSESVAGSSRRSDQPVNNRVLLISSCCASLAAESIGHDKIGRMDAGEVQDAPSLGAERALAETESLLNTELHSRAVDRRSRSARSEARSPDGQHHPGEQRVKQRNHGWFCSNMSRVRGG